MKTVFLDLIVKNHKTDRKGAFSKLISNIYIIYTLIIHKNLEYKQIRRIIFMKTRKSFDCVRTQ